MPNFTMLTNELQENSPDFMILPALKQMPRIPQVQSQFGTFAQGSVLAVQQKLENEYVLNVFDGVDFPSLPVLNRMVNNTHFTPSYAQAVVCTMLVILQYVREKSYFLCGVYGLLEFALSYPEVVGV